MIVTQASELSIMHPFVEYTSLEQMKQKSSVESNELTVAYEKFAPIIERQLAEYSMLQSQPDNSRFINKIYYENLKQINMIWLNELASQYANLIDREKLMRDIIAEMAEIDILYIGRCVNKSYSSGADLISIIANLKKSWCSTPKLKADINEIISGLDIQEHELDLQINLIHKWVARKEYYISSAEYQFMLIGFSAEEINQIIQLKDVQFIIVHNNLCDDYWLWKDRAGYFKTMSESNLTSMFRRYFSSEIEPYSFCELILGVDSDIFEYCLDQLENFREITTNDAGYFIILNLIALFHDIKTPIKLDMKCGYCPSVMRYMGALPICQKCQSKYICCKKPFKTWLYEGLFDVFCVMLNSKTYKYFDEEALSKFMNLKTQVSSQECLPDTNMQQKIYTVDEILEEMDVNPAYDFK